MNTVINSNALFVVGHRGACGYVAENTIESFERALAMGVAMIEFDVLKCATGELVIMHDDTVDRTTNGTGTVEEMSFTQLRSLRTDNGQSIPTLEETLNCINRQCPANIELKGIGVASSVARVCNWYCNQKGWMPDDFFVSSFHEDELEVFHKECPSIKMGMLFESTDIVDLEYVKTRIQPLQLHSIGIAFSSLTPELVNKAHALGLQLLVYTINDLSDLEHCINAGVDGIFSNYPDHMIATLKSKGQ